MDSLIRDDEPERLRALRGFEVLDTPAEQAFDDLTVLASQACQAPTALMTLIDADRQWFKSRVGMALSETDRKLAFCAHCILSREVMVVLDATVDDRFATNVLVTGPPYVRFYAGAPILTRTGLAIGTIAVIDYQPRTSFSAAQCEALRALSRVALAQLELRHQLLTQRQESTRAQTSLINSLERGRSLLHSALDATIIVDQSSGIVAINPAAEAMFGVLEAQAIGRHLHELVPTGGLPAVGRRLESRAHGLDGREFPVDVSFQRFGVEEPPLFIAVLRDATDRVRARELLQQSERQLRNVIDGLGPETFVGLTTPDGTLVEISRSALDVAGLAPADVLGKPLEDSYWFSHSGDARRQLRQALARAAAGEGSRYDAVVRVAADRLLDIDFSLRPVIDDAGRVIFLVPSANDITARKQAEVRLQRLNRVHALMSRINEAIVRVREVPELLDLAARVAVDAGAFTAAWIALKDAAPERLRIAARATGPTCPALSVDDLAVGAEGRLALDTLRGTRVVVNDLADHPPGDPWRDLAMDRGCQSMVSLPLTVCGTTVGVFTLCAREPGFFDAEELRLLDELAIDIAFALEAYENQTQRSRAERELMQLQRQQQAILDAAAYGIHVVDTTGRIMFENRASLRMLGWTAADLVGKPSHAAIHHSRPDGAPYPLQECPINATLRDGQARTIRHEHFWTQQGASFPVEYTVAPLRDAADRILGAAVVYADITERKELEERLRQSQKMEAVGELAGGVAHDFNNLLTVIYGNASLLLSREEPMPDGDGFLADILAAAERAGALTRQLLAFSRKQPLQSVDLDVNGVVTGTMRLLRRVMREDIAVDTDLAEALPTAHADAGMLEQVVMNLVVNARDAMPTGGRLTIATALAVAPEEAPDAPEAAGRFVRVSVADTGTGIAIGDQRRIFEPFFTTKGVGHGTGLGLATVYGILRQHGGWITVESAPGEGATFHTFWPVSDVSSPAIPSAHPALDPRGAETVLLVEDDPNVRSAGRRMLERYGYVVCEAQSGESALRLWDEKGDQIAVVITDMVMPDMSGSAVARALRQRRSDVRVIFVSGYSPELFGSELLRDGSVSFLPKPYTARELAEAVRRSIRGS